MKMVWKPAKEILVKWSIEDVPELWPDWFHDRFKSRDLLASLERKGRLEAFRESNRDRTDELVSRCLSAKTPEERCLLLGKTQPMLVALYYDRIVFVTYYLDHCIPWRFDRDCEIPEDWWTFLHLLLLQKWVDDAH